MKYVIAVFLFVGSSIFLPSGSALSQGAVPEATATHLRGIGIVLIRSHDPKSLADFYRALGFKDWLSSERIIGMHAGGGEALEIGYLDEGVELGPPVTSRTQVRAVAVFGTHNLKEVVENAEKNGALFVESFGEGDRIDLYYIADPEGNVMGFMERGPMFGDDMDVPEGAPANESASE